MTVSELIAKLGQYADDLEVAVQIVNEHDGDVTFSEPDFYVLNIEPPGNPYRHEVRDREVGRPRVGVLVLR